MAAASLLTGFSNLNPLVTDCLRIVPSGFEDYDSPPVFAPPKRQPEASESVQLPPVQHNQKELQGVLHDHKERSSTSVVHRNAKFTYIALQTRTALAYDTVKTFTNKLGRQGNELLRVYIPKSIFQIFPC